MKMKIKNRTRVAFAVALFAVLGLAAQNEQAITGEVMDSSCAKTGSHEMMQRQRGLQTNAAGDKACTLACVKSDASFVLYDPATQTVYQLDDQKKPAQFAGEKVKVTGRIDKTDSMIYVVAIDKAP